MLKKMALEVKQSKQTKLFVISMNIAEIESVCTISRVFRNEDNSLGGYQRTELKNHVDNISKYIMSDMSIMPNSIIICMNSTIKIKELNDNLCELHIPSDKKTGVIVDGQQRVAALKMSGRKDFNLLVSLFISDDVEFERQQFLLINSAKPLPRSLIYELIPYSGDALSDTLLKRKLPSLITQYLNYDQGSPLLGLIKMTTNPEGIIADNSMMKMLDNSIREGALYEYRNPDTGLIDSSKYQDAIDMINMYFCSVREVFHEDWGKKPKESRLFHGAGIIALGQLFDEFFYGYHLHRREDSFFEYSVVKLHQIKPYCRWSSGSWDFGQDAEGMVISRKWNQIQNLSQDISMVTKYLLKIYDCLERGKSVVKSQ